MLQWPPGLARDTGWDGNTAIASAAASVGAFSFASGSADSALLASLADGSYTAEVRGASKDIGIALVEIYDTTPCLGHPAADQCLGSARDWHWLGNADRRIQCRRQHRRDGVDQRLRPRPCLLAFRGVTDHLDEPDQTLFNSSGAVVANTSGYQLDTQAAAVAASVGAFSWGDYGTRDAPLLVTLPPGSYSAQV